MVKLPSYYFAWSLYPATTNEKSFLAAKNNEKTEYKIAYISYKHACSSPLITTTSIKKMHF